jgi:hypothetical protein
MQPQANLPAALNIGQAERDAWRSLLEARGDREAVLRAFLASWGLTFVEIGEVLSLSHTFVSRMLGGASAPRKRIDQLEALGIPGFLLPAEAVRRRRVLAA